MWTKEGRYRGAGEYRGGGGRLRSHTGRKGKEIMKDI